MFKYSHSRSLYTIGLQLEGPYCASNAKLQQCIKVGGRAYSLTSLFCYKRCVIARAFPLISAISNLQSMVCKGSKNGLRQDS